MLISDSTPAMLDTRRSGAASIAYRSNVVFPTPGPPRSITVPLKPPRTAYPVDRRPLRLPAEQRELLSRLARPPRPGPIIDRYRFHSPVLTS